METIKKEVEPCDNFYDHVCGNFKINGSRKYDCASCQHNRLIQEAIIKSVEVIDNDPEVAQYKQSVKVAYRQCKSFGNLNWQQELYREIATKIGQLSLLDEEKVIKNETEPITNNLMEIWQFIGKAEREFNADICDLGEI